MPESQIHVFAAGTKGFLVRGIELLHNHAPEWRAPRYAGVRAGPRVTKIVLSEHEFRKELDGARRISNVDPMQDHFLYPLAGYVLPADPGLVQAAQARFSQLAKQWPAVGDHMYALEMLDGGESVYQWLQSKEQRSLTERQVLQAIDQLIGGLVSLHSHKMAHKDLHRHNAVLRILPGQAGDAEARWIDTSDLTEDADAMVQARDIKQAIDVLVEITGLHAGTSAKLRQVRAHIPKARLANAAKLADLYDHAKATPVSSPARSPIRPTNPYDSPVHMWNDGSPLSAVSPLQAARSRLVNQASPDGTPPRKRRLPPSPS